MRSGAVQSANWPAFSTVLVALYRGLANGELAGVIASTIVRMLCGYAIGTVLGIAVGTAIALWRPVRLTFTPAIELLRPVPVTAIVPPLIFVLGIDDKLKVACVAFAVFFPVVTNTIGGVGAVDEIYLKVARTFGIPRWKTIRAVIVPAALPYIFAGMRTALAFALVVTVIAEMLAGSQGVGHYLLSMQYALKAPEMYASIILLTLVAYALNRLFVAWESRVIGWARSREAHEAA